MRSTDALRSVCFQFCVAAVVAACFLGFLQHASAEAPVKVPAKPATATLQPGEVVNEPSKEEKNAKSLETSKAIDDMRQVQKARDLIKKSPVFTQAESNRRKLNSEQLKEYRRRIGPLPKSVEGAELPQEELVDLQMDMMLISLQLMEAGIEENVLQAACQCLAIELLKLRVLENYLAEIAEDEQAKEVDRQQKEAHSAKKTVAAKASPEPVKSGSKPKAEFSLSASKVSAEEANEATRKKLAATCSVEFADTSLEEALKVITDKGNVQCHIEPQSLRMAGGDPNAPVQLKMKDVPLEMVLTQLLRDKNLGYTLEHGVVMVCTAWNIPAETETKVYAAPNHTEHALAILVQNVLQRQSSAIAPVATSSLASHSGMPLYASFPEGLVEGGGTIECTATECTATIAPPTCYIAPCYPGPVVRQVPYSFNGFSSVHAFRGTIVVTTTAEEHGRIEKLIKQLSEAKALDASGPQPSVCTPHVTAAPPAYTSPPAYTTPGYPAYSAPGNPAPPQVVPVTVFNPDGTSRTVMAPQPVPALPQAARPATIPPPGEFGTE
ncbi:MAG: hypothetical protein SGJ20_10585 [Planctomycetota bacterium]|nr:hypothetical protein [Planctomycetota bacterium]